MLRTEPIFLQGFLREADELSEDDFLAKHDHPFLVVPGIEVSCLESVIGAALPQGQEPSAQWSSLSASGVGTVVVCLGLRPKDRLSMDRMTLGRAPEADIVILDDTVSKFHLEISWDAIRERCLLTDLNSRNGTRISDQVVPPGANGRISSGDTLKLGTVKARFFTSRAFLSWLRNRAVGSSPDVNWLIGLDSEHSAESYYRMR